jgi:hypothetical protein
MSRNNSFTSSFELRDALRFTRRGLLFSAPFFLYVFFILVVDPFNFISQQSVIPDDVKLHTSYELNPCFWKMNIYRRKPSGSILLGDSRMMAISGTRLKELTGEEYFNFAYGGASLREIIDTFWFAAGQQHLKNVYVGLNLAVYNDYNITYRTKTYESISQNPALYFVNRTVLESALYSSYSHLTRTDLKLGVPTSDAATFWDHQLQDIDAAYFRNYVDPKNYREELKKIAAYCLEQGIHLTFIIFPTHVDVQKLITEYHLDGFNEAFRADLKALAVVYDFDFKNSITERRENFSDPDHTIGPIRDIITREVWIGPVQLGRKL